ncbi:DUF1819 family protein [Natronospora cellulosivora (SeqCode)]
MNKELQYSTAIKNKPFLYIELKKMAELKLNNLEMSDKELKNKAMEDNIFQYNSKSRRQAITSTVSKRIKVLDRFLLEKLLNGSIDTSKQITIYSILKTDRLFYEFMDEVYKDKYQLRDPYLTDKDFNIFFQHKAEQSERVAKWVDYTYYKLKQVFIRILFEAGFIKDQKEREIQKAIISKELADHLKDKGDAKYLQAMLGGM